jgi:hypothetical protein
VRNLVIYLSPVFLLILSVNTFGQTRESTATVTVKDITPCSCFLGTTLTDITNATACDANDGSITIDVNGGSGDYSIRWTDEYGKAIGTTKEIRNLLPGYYFLAVTDNKNSSCTGQGYFEVGSDLAINFSVSSNTNCVRPTGSLAADVSGGSGNFAFEWTFPDGTKSTARILTGLKGGQYLLQVADLEKGCSISKSTTVRNPMNLTVETLSAKDNTSCVSPNGALSVSVSGGSGTYKYYWYDISKGAYTGYEKDLSGVGGGRYSLYVTDQESGCVVYQFFDVADRFNAPGYTFEIGPNTKCSGPSDGSVDLSPAGGSGPFTVTWTDGTSIIASTEDLSELAPGRYGFTIRNDATGCETVVDFNDDDAVVIPDASSPRLEIIVNAITNNSDCTDPDGAIQLSVDSERPYSFYWTGPDGFSSDEEDLSNLPAGTYVFHALASCTVSDNRPPVITPEPIAGTPKTPAIINLLDIVTDPDGNLDTASIRIVGTPASGVPWSLGENGQLSLSYQNIDFRGRDRIRIRACDLLDACTEQYIVIDIYSGEIVVYNAVAPHSTGDNKFMRILNLPEVGNTVSIYNRWGDKVYEVSNYDSHIPGKRFEGTAFGGAELPSGTYFYKIEFGDGRKALTGYLALKQ